VGFALLYETSVRGPKACNDYSGRKSLKQDQALLDHLQRF